MTVLRSLAALTTPGLLGALAEDLALQGLALLNIAALNFMHSQCF